MSFPVCNVRARCFSGGVKSRRLQELCSAYVKDIMRLFALACKADRECRAAELALYAPSAHLIQSMCNFAAKTRHSLLVEKVLFAGSLKKGFASCALYATEERFVLIERH